MNPIRLLSKMAPKTTNLNGGSGGSVVDRIDWRDAAHALVGVSHDANNWALYRFVGQEAKLKSVYRSLSMSIALFIKIRRYKVQPKTLDGLICAAVFEFTQPICVVCDGAGVIEHKYSSETLCNTCKGRGRKSISKRQRCSVIGINHKSYSDSHDEITKELMRLIGTWEQEIFRNIHIKMGDSA